MVVECRAGEAHICEEASSDRLFVGFSTVVAADGCGRYSSGDSWKGVSNDASARTEEREHFGGEYSR